MKIISISTAIAVKKLYLCPQQLLCYLDPAYIAVLCQVIVFLPVHLKVSSETYVSGFRMS